MNGHTLIDPTYKALPMDATVQQAQLQLKQQLCRFGAVCEKRNFMGFVSLDALLPLPKGASIVQHITHETCWVLTSYSEHDIIKTSRLHGIGCVALLNEENQYAGVISAQRMIEHMDMFAALEQSGVVLSIALNAPDDLLRHIVDVIESCGLHILHLHLSSTKSKRAQVVIKTNTENIERVLAALERHGYEVVGYTATQTRNLSDRYHFLKKYIDM